MFDLFKTFSWPLKLIDEDANFNIMPIAAQDCKQISKVFIIPKISKVSPLVILEVNASREVHFRVSRQPCFFRTGGPVKKMDEKIDTLFQHRTAFNPPFW